MTADVITRQFDFRSAAERVLSKQGMPGVDGVPAWRLRKDLAGCTAAVNPSPESCSAAQTLARVMIDGKFLYDYALKKHDSAKADPGNWQYQAGWKNLPKVALHEGFECKKPGLRWLGHSRDEECRDLPMVLNKIYGRMWESDSGYWKLCPTVNDEERKRYREMVEFMTGKWLEVAVFDATRTVLREIHNDNPNRKSKLYHSVHVARHDPAPALRDFELDVVTLLGYELLIVSCSADSSSGNIKRKGFEAVHRAQQIGGDGAKAIVVCASEPGEANTIEEDLQEHLGKGASIWIVSYRDSALKDQLEAILRNNMMWS